MSIKTCKRLPVDNYVIWISSPDRYMYVVKWHVSAINMINELLVGVSQGECLFPVPWFGDGRYTITLIIKKLGNFFEM